MTANITPLTGNTAKHDALLDRVSFARMDLADANFRTHDIGAANEASERLDAAERDLARYLRARHLRAA